MRLTKHEITSIKKVFKDIFKDGKIYLFGSRVDDSKKGGDIDLYIKLSYSLNIKERLNKKNIFKIKLENEIGEQKIDIVISKNIKNSIEKEALAKGVEL